MRARLAFGLAPLVVAIAWMLDATGVYVFRGGWAVWWPALLVVVGLAQLFVAPAWWEGPAFLVLAGAFLLAWRLDAIPGGFWPLAAPALLAVLAVLVIAGAFSTRRRARRWEGRIGRRADIPSRGDDVAVFGNVERRHEEEVHGGELTTVFGQLRADFRRASLPTEGAHVKATSVFGETELVVPEGWRVVLHGAPVFGRADNFAKAPPEGPTLDVECVSVFGNVRVVN